MSYNTSLMEGYHLKQFSDGYILINLSTDMKSISMEIGFPTLLVREMNMATIHVVLVVDMCLALRQHAIGKTKNY
jgi:hypothetical protein